MGKRQVIAAFIRGLIKGIRLSILGGKHGATVHRLGGWTPTETIRFEYDENTVTRIRKTNQR